MLWLAWQNKFQNCRKSRKKSSDTQILLMCPMTMLLEVSFPIP